MTKLGVEDEVELCHYRFEMPRHSFIFFGFWGVFIIIIVVFAQLNVNSEPVIPWDNCDMNRTWEPEMRPYLNKMQFESEKLKKDKLREKNLLYRRNNYSRIEYGTSLLSYCKAENEIRCNWNTKEATVDVPDGWNIKSISRTIELDPYVASGLRFLILECTSFRMTLALIRSSDILTSQKGPLPRIIQFVLSLAPYVSFLQSFSLFLITALHSEFDTEYISFVHPYAYLMVGVFTFLEMLIDLLQDSFDGRHIYIQTWKFYLKSVGFVAFTACFPNVVLKWIQFFKVKKCHAYVPLLDGCFEYICAASIISYNFINSLSRVEMYITPTVEDLKNVSSYSSQVYSPVFQTDQSTVYESLADRK